MASRLLALPRRGFLGAAAASVMGLGAAALSTQPMGWTATAHAEEAKPAQALSPDEWRSFKVLDTKQLAKNDATGIATKWLRFSLPTEDTPLGLPVAACFVTRAPIGSENEDGSRKQVIRPYTPVTTPETPEPVGYFDLVVKEYPTGKMSKHIGELKVGDTLDLKGPIPKFPYKPNMKKNIGMIAGGSGLTPMMQVASQILSNSDDKTQVSLVFANQSEDDIILKDELDKMAKEHANFKIHYMLDKPKNKDAWGKKGGIGYVNEQVVKEHLPPPADGNWILVCGPPPMMKAMSGDKAKDKSQGPLEGLLKTMGYNEDQVYKF
jgi:cytochrome-b5 reductase